MAKPKNTSKVEDPKVETPPVEDPKVETPPVEDPKVETPQVEDPKVETVKSEAEKLAEQVFKQYPNLNEVWICDSLTAFSSEELANAHVLNGGSWDRYTR
jgi:hypothetical protein